MRRPSPTSAKRWTLKIALCLLAGAVVVALCVAGAFLQDRLGKDDPATGLGRATAADGRIWKVLCMRSRWGTRLSAGTESPFFGGYTSTSGKPFADEARDEERLALALSRALPNESAYVEECYGYPFRCARSATFIDLATFSHRVVVGQPSKTGRRNPAIPTRILPLGFALNALFYAAVLLGVVECVAFARRRVRRGKGRCPSCGYDRAGLAEGAACPECGGKA